MHQSFTDALVTAVYYTVKIHHAVYYIVTKSIPNCKTHLFGK